MSSSFIVRHCNLLVGSPYFFKCKKLLIESSLEDESDQISEPWNFAKLSSSALLKRLSEVFGKKFNNDYYKVINFELVPAVSEEDSARMYFWDFDF